MKKVIVAIQNTLVCEAVTGALQKAGFFVEKSLSQDPDKIAAACETFFADVLLMDEPTSALDPISTSKIEDCVMQLKEKYTIVIVTHNMQQAVRISDKTVFFLLGEIIESGDTEQMFSKPKMKKTEDYITGRFG